MIKTEDNEIKVISKMDKEGLEQAEKMLIFAFVIVVLLSIYAFIFVTVTFGIICLVLLLCNLGTILVCRKLISNAGKEKLFLTLNKDELVVQDKKICNTEDITNFAYDSSASSMDLNQIFINYKTNKKHTKIIMLRGAVNKDFVNIANNYIQDLKKGNIDKFNKHTHIEENIKESKTDKEKIFDTKLLKSGKTIEVVFVGKTKDFVRNGNRTSLEHIMSTLIFMTKDKEIANFDSRLVEGLNVETLKENKYYKVSYSKKSGNYVFEKNDNVEFGVELIEKYKNDYKNHVQILFADNPEIWSEMELENKMGKLSSKIKTIAYFGTIILFGIGAFGYWFKNVDINVLVNILKIWAVFMVIILLVYSGVFVNITFKYKKNKLKY